MYRQRVVKEQGVAAIEHYCYEEHEDLRRAAMECMCNLIMNETVCSHDVCSSFFQDSNDW